MCRRRHALAFLALFVVGCGYQPFVRQDGPVAAEGVSVALLGNRCDLVKIRSGPGEDYYSLDQLHFDMRLSIQNDSSRTISVDARRLRLRVGANAGWPSTDVTPFDLRPGDRRELELSFRPAQDLGCNTLMSLMFEGAFQAADRPLAVRPISFVASDHAS